MKIYYVSMIWLMLGIPLQLRAQAQNVALGNNFKFRDGLFLNFEQFQQNQPAFVWGEVVDNMVSTKPGIIKVESFQVDTETLPLDSIWGFSRNGVPYIRTPRDTSEKRPFATFVAVRMIGKICLFSYEREQQKKVVIKAYNPLTGHPFREGAVIQKELVTEEKIIFFPTGEIENLNRAALLKWIKDDAELFDAFSNLGAQPDKEELYQTILMYNDRNRVYTFK